MKSTCVCVLSIIELKNARWNIEINNVFSMSIFLCWPRFPSKFLAQDTKQFQQNSAVPYLSNFQQLCEETCQPEVKRVSITLNVKCWYIDYVVIWIVDVKTKARQKYIFFF